MIDALNLFVNSVKDIYPNINEKNLEKHIETTFSRIASIRIDETDKDVAPMSIMYNDFTKGGSIKFEDKKMME